VENPDITYRDSLAQDHAGEEEKYTLVLANPPFAGSLDYESCAKDLQQVVKTKKTELLFLALFLRLLKPGGRAAVIVPDGVLFGSSNAHKSLRWMLIEDQKLDAVISLWRRAKCAHLPRTIVEPAARDSRQGEDFRRYLADIGWRQTVAERHRKHVLKAE
jgi:tRNA1(Val) A37 N6-methylase TrmN6